MLKRIATVFCLLSCCVFGNAQKVKTKFEQTKGEETPTYFEAIEWWKKLDAQSGKVKMLEKGLTDAGYPLHLIFVSNNGDYNVANIKKNNKRIIFINNGIHPGEPDGIDASMLLARDIVENRISIPDNIVLAIIPVYNIDGALNRSAFYRINQNGPKEFGFRGNGQNLDLNRDFIKNDSRNARAFVQIFHELDPDVFLDNHVSNGADYQHVMTLLTSQHTKLGGEMGIYLNQVFEKAIYESMAAKKYPLIPYVGAPAGAADKGWVEYFDGPRYSSGFASLWSTFAFVPETHMLKPYPQRVDATYELMRSFIEFTSKNSEKIKTLRQQTKEAIKNATSFPVSWQVDTSKSQLYTFYGYEAGYKPSEVSGLNRLYYDRNKPFQIQVPVKNSYKEQLVKQKPKAYIIPQGWWKVTDLLKLNKVTMHQLKRDTVIEVEAYTIENFKSPTQPYEGHHNLSQVKISSKKIQKKFLKGDWYIPLNQVANRFLVETLEPEAPDSYFSWNFFDGILGRKEGFSAYAYEDDAAQYLKEHPALKKQLEERRAADSNFAKNASAQLNFVFQNSPYFEPAYKLYPVFRVL